MNKSFLLWGTGELGKKTYLTSKLRNYDVNILSFLDNDKTKENESLYNLNIYHPDMLKYIKDDENIIVICSMYEKEIIEQLIKLGYEKEKDFITQKQFMNYLNYMTAIQQISYFGDLKIIIGANQTTQKGWISTNQHFLDMLKEDDWKRMFAFGTIDNILAEHVWEHLTFEDGVKAARNCKKYLKEGGRLRIAVPDGYHPDQWYIEWVKPGGAGDAADDHKVLYNHITMEQMLKEAGFENVVKVEYYDDEKKFNYKKWNSNEGYIQRSKDNDQRNWGNKLIYSSLIIDAIK